MKYKHTIWLFILILGFLGNCGGSSSSAPQVSLPIPNNDDVEISSPDTDGFVAITGGTSSVPDSATLIVTVDTTTSSLFETWQKKFQTFMITEAHAQSCSSSLPECPTLDGDNSCQFEAETDGSFSLEVPATINNSITVSYLDPSTCLERTLISGRRPDRNSIRLPNGTASFTINPSDNSAFLFVDSASVDNPILRVDLDTARIENTYPLENVGEAEEIKIRPTNDGQPYFIVETNDYIKIGNVTESGDFNENNLIELVTDDLSSTGGLNFLGALNFDYDPAISCVDPGLFTPAELASGNAQFTRMFFTDQEDVFFLDFVGNISNVSPLNINIDDSGDTQYVLQDVDIVVPAAPSSNISVVKHIGGFGPMIPEFHLVFGVRVTANTSFYVAGLSGENGLDNMCAGNLFFPPAQVVDIGGSGNDAIVTETINTVDADDEPQKFVQFLDTVNQQIFVLNMSSLEIDSKLILESDDNEFTREIDGLDDETDLLSLNTNAELMFPLIRSDEVAEYFILSGFFGGSDFLPQYNLDAELEPDSFVYTFNPLKILFDEERNRLLILDQGPRRAGDLPRQSFLKILTLDD